jgi:hypothetical protein
MVQGHAFSWRAPDGGVRTTVVGKVSVALGASGTPFVAAEPIVQFDRIAADRRFVDEVGELMPWTTVASVVVRGGPLRVEVHGAGSQPRTIDVKEGAPVGISMASEARARLAKQHLSRGEDGLLAVAPGTDARYFSAAPPWQGIDPLRGTERFVIERGSQRVVVGPLPGIALVADVAVAGRPRRVALGFDLVVLDAAKGRLSFVARAVLVGFGELRDMRMTMRGEVGTSDVGDPPPASMRGPSANERLAGTMMVPEGSRPVPHAPTPFAAVPGPGPRVPARTGPNLPIDEEPTNAIPPAAMAASKRRAPDHLASTAPISPVLLARTTMPFASGPKRSESRPDVPATPFDRGFAPAPTKPAANVGRTVSGPAYPDMTLPVEGVPIATRHAPVAGSPEEAWSVLPSHEVAGGHAPQGPASSETSQDEGPRVAAPRKGAMAKPRPRKR